LINWAIKFGVKTVWLSFKLTQLADLLQNNGFEVVEAEKIWERQVVAFLRGRSIDGSSLLLDPSMNIEGSLL
jgi:hypothetical protein